MAYIEGHARDQVLLLPVSVEDYVAADNPVRFIDAFVDDLDLGSPGFQRARPKATGRPGRDPADLLKLYRYGYLNRVRSNRRLAAEATRNLKLMWLLRGVGPDFRTIVDFRRNNRAAFKAVFRAFVVLCRQLDLFGRELLAVEGTRLKAVNSRSRNFSRERLATYLASADARLALYLAELDEIDRGGDGAGTGRADTLATKIARLREQRQASAALLDQLQESGEGQSSLTDPEARLIVAHSKVTAGITPYIPRPHRGIAVGNGLFPKERFRYDSAADAYHCPAGQVLDTRYNSVTRGHVSIQYSSPAACAGCQMKTRCTKVRWRRISRWEKEEVIELMAERLARQPDILVIRKSTVEHPFGTIKQSMNQARS